MMLQDFDLTQDPFAIVPDGPVENWAGRPELEEELIDLVKGVRARDIGSTEFLILYGEYGAGKSHALRYLKTQIERRTDDFNSLVLYLERPRVSTKINFFEIYKYLIRDLGRERIKNFCDRLNTEVNSLADARAQQAGHGQYADKVSFRKAVVEDFSAAERPMVRLLLRGSEDIGRVFDFLSAAPKSNGGIEYEGAIDSDFMAARVLGDFFRTITMEIAPNVRLVESVYLFIDEGEALLDAKASESELVFNGLRELINGVPYRFGLILSFTGGTSLIEAYMPQHLIKRMTHDFIVVPMLEEDEALEFLKERINFFRPAVSAYKGTFYPFDEDAVKVIIEHNTQVTPRNLFRDCKRVLERAIRRHGLQPGDSISKELAEQILGLA
jgi:hypothetical protein